MKIVLNIDMYAKALLTIITACVIWLIVQQLVPAAAATRRSSQPATMPASTQQAGGIMRPDKRVVEAGEFVLLDSEGKRHAELTVSPIGPRLLFYDGDGNTRLAIGLARETMPYVRLQGESDASEPSLNLWVKGEELGLDMVDASGTRRVGLFVIEDRVDFKLKANTGKHELWLGAFDESGAGIAIADGEGKKGVELGSRGLSLFDKQDNQRLRVSLNEEDSPMVTLYGENNSGAEITPSALKLFDSKSVRFSASLDEEYSPTVTLVDKNKGGTILIPKALKLVDKQLDVRLYAALREDDSPIVSLSDGTRTRAALGVIPLETIKTGATSRTSPSSLTLFDKEGKVLWRMPQD